MAGEAKKRGTRPERVAAAIERDKAAELAHEGRRIELANRGLDRHLEHGNRQIVVAGCGRPFGNGMALGSMAIAMALATVGGRGK